jgi:hypothetical protein
MLVPIMQNFAPFIASSLYGSKGYQFLQDPNNWDQSMQAYGSGAGMLARQSQRSLGQTREQLARMGLGRSGAMAAAGQQSAMGLADQQANLFTQLQQQSVQNRLMGAQRATNAEQEIARLALAMTPQPRVTPQKHDLLGGGIAQGLGTAIGMLPFAL